MQDVPGGEERPRNELAFRRANDSLYETFAREGHEEGYPFLCECSDRLCTTVVILSLTKYDDVRSHPGRFVVAAGHYRLEGDRIVEAEEDFQVIEKTGWPGRSPPPPGTVA
jgi:hypothetical protein